MAIRIGEDGTIINDDQVISSSGTIIRDDGTIESSNIVSSSAPQRNYVSHVAPVSPLENGGNRQSQMSEEPQVPVAQPEHRSTGFSTMTVGISAWNPPENTGFLFLIFLKMKSMLPLPTSNG